MSGKDMPTDADRAAILDELIELGGALTEIEPDEFSIADFAARAQVSYMRAAAAVERLLKQGLVTRRWAVSDGRRVRAYKKVEA